VLQINNAPPVLPGPLASAVSRIYFWQEGLLNAVPILGAATLLVGLTILIATRPHPSVAVPAETPPSEASGQEPAKP
jgi:hypothetical protein